VVLQDDESDPQPIQLGYRRNEMLERAPAPPSWPPKPGELNPALHGSPLKRCGGLPFCSPHIQLVRVRFYLRLSEF
jgi:hypothetical protein